MTDKTDILKKYFGYGSFRSGQPELIDNILAGRDTLGIMPTGAGKSICYQVPALLFDGPTVVISPLISLMMDQVYALSQMGVPAAYINSSLSYAEYSAVLAGIRAGKYKIIYAAPERLSDEAFLSAVAFSGVSHISVDEAHCVSQWGQDFRPSYLRIADFVASLPDRPVVSAFTATATAAVRDDIVRQLKLNSPFVRTTGFDRQNLYFAVKKPKDKMAELVSYVREHENECGIVYCSTRKNTDAVCEGLNRAGFPCVCYHAGLSDEERRKNQSDFIFDRCRIIAATNAFGMGIDKSNVRYVIHYNMPKNIESYYQEAGRAGRDGEPADCILYYSGQDVVVNQFLIKNRQQDEALVSSSGDSSETFSAQEKDLELLKAMTFYCHTGKCLREYILRYFGEQPPPRCENCSNCLAVCKETDITVDVRKIMSCIKRTGERFGVKMICDVLRGSKSRKVVDYRFHELSVYGIMKDSGESRIRDIIGFLTAEGYIVNTGGEYPVLVLAEKASGVLFGGERLSMKLAADSQEEKKTQAPEKKKHAAAERRRIPDDGKGAEINEHLFAELKKLRSSFAKEQRVPAYVVFSDAALADMCRRMPSNDAEFLAVSGVGQAKLEKYGKAFMRVIREF